MTTPKKKQFPAYLTLALITLVAALALALTHAITAGPIAENERIAREKTYGVVMQNAVFTDVEIPEGADVTALVEARDDAGTLLGYCAVASKQGYQSEVSVTLAANLEGEIIGLSVASGGETGGVGTRAADPAFAEQFVGLGLDGGKVEAVTGATVTSTAALDAANRCLDCIARLLEKGTPQLLAFGVKEEPAMPSNYIANGENLTGSARGYQSDVKATVSVQDGVVTALTVDSTGETPSFGVRCTEDASFAAQFVGKSAPFVVGENIDALSGATLTSKALTAAVNAALANPDAPAYIANGENLTGSARGYQSDVKATVSVQDGVVTALTVDSTGETPSFGVRCTEDASFAAQFVGKSAPFVVGENIDALSGATLTSKALTAAVNAALAEGNASAPEATAEPTVEPTAAPTAEPQAEDVLAPAAPAQTASAPGFGEQPVTVTVTIVDGVVETLTVDASTQTPGLGSQCEEDAFTSQFIGKTGPFTLGEGIDGVSNATMTSQAVVTALNSLFPAEEVPAAPAAPAQTASAPGFGEQPVTVTVTIVDGVVETLTVDASTQTPGLGSQCEEDAFTSQFIGKTGPFTLGEGIDGVSNATMTSQAVVTALNSLLPAEEVPAAPAAPAQTASAPGFGEQPVTVTVTIVDGVVETLTVDASTQTPSLGSQCEEDAFTSQFIGKTGPFTLGEGIDGVSNATMTSQAVVTALNSLLPTEEVPAAPVTPVPPVPRTAKVKGWREGVVVTVTADEQGVITALTVDASGEFRALGGLCGEEAFTAQFIGKTAPLTLHQDIDGVTGATLTSQAVVDAVNELLSK